MTFRTLRNAFLCLCFASCLLPIGLWYRSYHWSDTFYLSGPMPAGHRITSFNGRVYFDEAFYIRNDHPKQWHVHLPGVDLPVVSIRSSAVTSKATGLSIPDWLVVGAMVTLAAGFAAAPGLTFRFSLRAIVMLITFIALLLGAMHYILRSDSFKAVNSAGGGSRLEDSTR